MTMLRYVAIASPITPRDTPQSFADVVKADLGIGLYEQDAPGLPDLTDRQMRQLADTMVAAFAGQSHFPLGIQLGLDAVLSQSAPRYLDGVTIDLVVDEGSPYFDQFATLLEMSASRRLGGLEVTVQRLRCPVPTLFRCDQALAGAILGDLVDLRPRGDEVVVVDGMVGDLGFRTPLLRMAAESRCPVVTARSGSATWQKGSPVESSAHLAHVVASLQSAEFSAGRAEVPSHVFSLDGARPSWAALRRLEATRWNVSGSHSAVAQVLRSRAGTYARGVELEDLVSRWLDLRIFDGSVVTEMVLHDQSHALSVDRNVAVIAGQLFEDEAITGEDLFRLGCAAWLHDCGHTPVHLETPDGTSGVPDEPSFVRSFHGPLGSLRIGRIREVLGLGAEDAPWVRVLTGHHQGWTHCGSEEQPKADENDSPEYAAYRRLLTRTLGDSMAEVGLKVDQTAKVQQLLSLLRVSDALDVGRHRAQHQDLHVRQFPDYVRAYLQRCCEAIGVGESTRQLVYDLTDLGTFGARIIDNHKNGDELGRWLDATAIRVNRRLDCLPTPDRGRVETLARQALSYVKYLFQQHEHFQVHRRINTVLPVLGGTSGSRSLTALVLPSALDGRASPAAEQAKALADVTDYLTKELGLGSTAQGDRGYAPKAPIRAALASLGLHLERGGTFTAVVQVPTWWPAFLERESSALAQSPPSRQRVLLVDSPLGSDEIFEERADHREAEDSVADLVSGFDD